MEKKKGFFKNLINKIDEKIKKKSEKSCCECSKEDKCCK